MDEPVQSQAEDNVGFAFLASFASSTATVLGSLLPFVVNIKDTRWLGVSLALSAGIMIYVSLVEIYKEGWEKFQEAKKYDGWDLMNPNLASTLSLFLGVLSAAALDAFVHRIHPDDDSDDLDNLGFSAYESGINPAAVDSGGKDCQIRINIEERTDGAPNDLPLEKVKDTKSDKTLKRMTLLAGLAMAIHNIPEGLVTFVTALDSVELGITICVAIAIHNIPEGIIVAIPVYYATGSRWKAFAWGAVAGLTEPLGAVLGYLIFRLSSVEQPDGHKTLAKSVLGTMLNLVAGMLIFVTFVELLPTAQKYCPSSKVVACGLFAGMLIMSLSEVVRSLI